MSSVRLEQSAASSRVVGYVFSNACGLSDLVVAWQLWDGTSLSPTRLLTVQNVSGPQTKGSDTAALTQHRHGRRTHALRTVGDWWSGPHSLYLGSSNEVSTRGVYSAIARTLDDLLTAWVRWTKHG